MRKRSAWPTSSLGSAFCRAVPANAAFSRVPQARPDFRAVPGTNLRIWGRPIGRSPAAGRTSHAGTNIPPISVASSAEMTLTARQRVSCHTQAALFAAWVCASGHPQASPCYAWVWHQSVPNKVAKHVRPFSVPPSDRLFPSRAKLPDRQFRHLGSAVL